jgi:hypothetical protein
MSSGTEEGRRQRRRVKLAIASSFGLLVAVGFVGISWTVEGAPGHVYYWGLRLPITACLVLGWTGLVFSAIPLLIKLTTRRTVHTSAEESEEELEVRANHLCSLLPLVESATWKSKLALSLFLVGFIAGAWWGVRSSRPALVVISTIAALIFVWQVARAFVFRVDFFSDYIRFRTFRGSQNRQYTDVLDVGPGYNGNEVRVWFTDQTKLTVHADRLKPADILLIITAGQLAHPHQ